MADPKKSLPVRSEMDTDERVQVKIVDKTTPSQQMTVDTDNNAHVECHGNDPAGIDRALILTEEGRSTARGDYDGTTNTKPSASGLIVHERNATHNETKQTKRPTAVDGASDSVCLDVSMHDESGQPFGQSNPLPVVLSESEGTEIQDFNQSSSVAEDATANHDYSVANGDTFILKRILVSASSRFKGELQIGDGGVSEVFTTKAVVFGSVANPNSVIDLSGAGITVVGTANTTTVRIVKMNRDDDSQDLYSTIIGVTL